MDFTHRTVNSENREHSTHLRIPEHLTGYLALGGAHKYLLGIFSYMFIIRVPIDGSGDSLLLF